jgi:hypothetical protein
VLPVAAWYQWSMVRKFVFMQGKPKMPEQPDEILYDKQLDENE